MGSENPKKKKKSRHVKKEGQMKYGQQLKSHRTPACQSAEQSRAEVQSLLVVGFGPLLRDGSLDQKAS